MNTIEYHRRQVRLAVRVGMAPALLAIVGSGACSDRPKGCEMSAPNWHADSTPVKESVKKVVDKYVKDQKGWPQDDYFLQSGGLDPEGNQIVQVIYKGDIRRGREGHLGGGESFDAIVSGKKARVLRIYRYQ